MVQDLEPLTTPNTVLTDCLNGTIITYNGNEFVLQNDMGNCKVERAKLSPGFLPMGMKEYGGIIYIASYNPDTQECEVGSFPSPERDITGTDSIENQTGLQDGYFDTNDYSTSILRLIPSGVFTPEEITSKIQKLNEEEVLKLSPGDMYITTYEITPPANPNPGAVVINNANFNNYFSYDESDKKTFAINFYKIDSGNNIVKIPNNEVKTIAYRTDIESDEYIYYTQNSAGSIAVELSLNTLDYFNSSVREISRRVEENKKIRVEAVGLSNSDINFEGVRVDLFKNQQTPSERKSFHVKKEGVDDKISASVRDFIENDIVRCDITPYNQYGYMPKLMQSFSLEIGRNAFGNEVNDVFKWRVDEVNNRLELDFDFKYDTDNVLKLYLEFYDTWSNVSTIKPIPAPSVYGPMRLSIGLTDEPTTNIFNEYPEPPNVPSPTSQIGGISFSKLSISRSDIEIPYLINENLNNGLRLIRNDNLLRKNHFYIVRLCGYEEDSSSGSIIRTFHDIYRGLYTSDIYNDIYEEQSNLTSDNILYQPNFNKIPFPKEKITYSAKIENKSTLTLGTIPDPSYNSGPLTTVSNTTYPFSLNGTISPALGGVINAHTRYTYNKSYSINLTKPDKYIYGSLADNTLQLDNPQGVVNMDSYMSGPANIATLSAANTARLQVPNLNTNSSTHTLNLTLSTRRGVQGSVYEPIIVGEFESVLLGNEYLYEPNFNTVVSECGNSVNATIASRRTNQNDAQCGDNIRCNITSCDPIHLKIRNAVTGGPSETLGVASPRQLNDSQINNIVTLNTVTGKQFFTVKHGERSRHGVSPGASMKSLYFKQSGTTDRILSFVATKNISDATFNTSIRDFLNKLKVTKKVGTDEITTYYVLPDTLIAHDEGTETKFSQAHYDIKSVWNNPLSKIYIFNSIIISESSSVIPFNTSNLNDLIIESSNKSGHNLIEGVNFTLDDSVNFIPFIDSDTNIAPSISPLFLDEEVIIRAVSSELRNAFANSKNMYEQELEKVENTDDKVSIEIVDSVFPTEDLMDFVNIFKYDSVDDQLVIHNEPPWLVTRAANGASNNQDTRVRNVDSVTKNYNFQ